jgi:hypothetical protein
MRVLILIVCLLCIIGKSIAWDTGGKSSGGTTKIPILSDYSTASTTTPTNVGGLGWPIAANQTQSFKCVLATLQANAGSSVRYNLTGPNSPVFASWGLMRYYNLDAASFYLYTGFSTSAQTKLMTSGNMTTQQYQFIEGFIMNGANAGTIQLQGSTSAAYKSYVYTGSYCTVW